MDRSQQIEYIANVAFADELASEAENPESPHYERLRREGYLSPGGELTIAILYYQMQKQFREYARDLLRCVEHSAHWKFLMDIADDAGKRECLYLLYCEAVGHGVGFWDGSRTWAHITNLEDPPGTLANWAKHFTPAVKYKEAPMVGDVLRRADPLRKMP